MPRRPNILILCSDEHHAGIGGYAGNSIIRTPVLDRLAQEGVMFTNTYTPSPICVPARQCLAAGQFPRTCGCRVYGDDLEPGYMTWPMRLSQYGYITTACGKLHHMGPDQMHGWLRRIGMDDQLNTSRRTYIPGVQLEEWAENDRRTSERYPKWSDAEEIRRARAGESPYTVWDEYATMGAENVIREYFLNADYDRPQDLYPHALYVGFNNPHFPFIAPREKFEYYLNRVQPMIDNNAFEHPWLGKSNWENGPVTVGNGEKVTPRELQRAFAAYYANIEACDERYGRVLQTLQACGQNLDDWIIVYFSDHGDMLGEHGIWGKEKFFEASVRVPMIIRWPKHLPKGKIVEKNVNLCDLFATFCELCEIPIPEGLDSRSMVPLMHGDVSQWDNETVSQFCMPRAGAQARYGTEYDEDHLMIKRDHLKYMYLGKHQLEILFDLKRDPGETQNFIGDSQYMKSLKKFRHRCSELGYMKSTTTD